MQKRFLLQLCAGFVIALGVAKAWAQAPTNVVLKTTQGTIVVELNAAKAPKTVENFLTYVKNGHYNGTVFHRVIQHFMIQGGGFTKDMQQKATRPPIAIESRNGLKNTRGSIAMARTNDPNSATSQFFINVVDNPNLDFPSFDGHGYTVFGRVIHGMDVVDKIRAVRTGNVGFHQDVPLEPVIIESATIQKD
ncbi:peptidylprolyl isomerase [Parvibium lacunae]|uniref:Peptidyl-prolyl cis-trans isomerase n=1 Tax=Parvibium lacunae TaxID=1888893 RepID=A0A368L763_9BURK|nr:peptidylprolyl isomerase [Parvibium lacunae]RCS59457.1 peptidyl-prolyl cis-trans isomerase [Parvibium lacunae]